MGESAQYGLWGVLIAAVGALLGVLKYRGERDKVPADIRLTLATARKAEVEADASLIDRMASYLDRVEERLKEEHLNVMRLEAEKKVLEGRVELLEEQLRREAAFRESKGWKLTDQGEG